MDTDSETEWDEPETHSEPEWDEPEGEPPGCSAKGKKPCRVCRMITHRRCRSCNEAFCDGCWLVWWRHHVAGTVCTESEPEPRFCRKEPMPEPMPVFQPEVEPECEGAGRTRRMVRGTQLQAMAAANLIRCHGKSSAGLLLLNLLNDFWMYVLFRNRLRDRLCVIMWKGWGDGVNYVEKGRN